MAVNYFLILKNIEKMRSQFPEDRRVIWIDVPDGDEKGRSKSNSREVDAVIARVKTFT